MRDDVKEGAGKGFALRRVAPTTAAERLMREEGMARALRLGATPYRDADGKGRHIPFKEANLAPIVPWIRDPKAKRGFWVRDRNNLGLLYVVPNAEPEAAEEAEDRTGSSESAEEEVLVGGGGADVVLGQADAATDDQALLAEPADTQPAPGADSAAEPEEAPVLHYPDIPLSRLDPTWQLPEDAKADELPVINMEKDRIRNIIANEPAIFEIEDSDSAEVERPIYEQEPLGYWEVWVHQDVIEHVAETEGVDPRLLKALVYFENTRGRSYGAHFEWLHLSDSLLPMNIKESVWAALVGEGEEFSDPFVNIQAGARLVRRILERVPDPTVAKVGSIWHFTGRETVSDNGARIADIHQSRPWEMVPQQFSEDALSKMPTRKAFVAHYRRRREELKGQLPYN